MKLRTDLLQVLTTEDILEDALQDQHRFSKEPTFSKTGIGSLSPTSIEDYEKEQARNTAFIKKLKARLPERKDGD